MALLESAIHLPQLRLLHAFQALIYVAAIVLVHRNSSWGYGAGFAIAIAWNAMSIFVSHLVHAGAVVMLSMRAGQLHDLVPMMVTLGGLGTLYSLAPLSLPLQAQSQECGGSSWAAAFCPSPTLP